MRAATAALLQAARVFQAAADHINDLEKHMHRVGHCLPGLACETCSICGSQSEEPVVLLQAAEVGWAAARTHQ